MLRLKPKKFSGKANIYTKFRPSYPHKRVDYLFVKAPAWVGDDVGSETVAFTKGLLQRFGRAIEIESKRDMLSHAYSPCENDEIYPMILLEMTNFLINSAKTA